MQKFSGGDFLDLILSRITKMLEDQNMTGRQLSTALGLNRNVYFDWKSGKSSSYLKYLPQIADCFGVSRDYLLGLVDQPYPSPQNSTGRKSVLFVFTDDQDEELFNRLYTLGILDSKGVNSQMLDLIELLLDNHAKAVKLTPIAKTIHEPKR